MASDPSPDYDASVSENELDEVGLISPVPVPVSGTSAAPQKKGITSNISGQVKKPSWNVENDKSILNVTPTITTSMYGAKEPPTRASTENQAILLKARLLQLKPEEEAEVNKALRGEIAITLIEDTPTETGLDFTADDFKRINPSDPDYFNDQILLGYIFLLSQRLNSLRKTYPSEEIPKYAFMISYFFDTLYFEQKRCGKKGLEAYSYDRVKKWTNKAGNIGTFQQDFVFFPINWKEECHWTLSLVDIKDHKIYFMDPLIGHSDPTLIAVLTLRWLRDEANENNITFDAKQWEFIQVSCCQQTNGVDCGVFVLMFIDLIIDGLSIHRTSKNIKQSDM